MSLVPRLLFLLSFLNSLGQEWTALNQESMLSYQSGNYKQAIVYADSALQLAEDIYGKVSDQYLSSLSNRAYAEAGLGENSHALADFKTVTNLSFELYSLPHVSQVESLLEVAKQFLSLSEYDSCAYFINKSRYLYTTIPEKNKHHSDTSFYPLMDVYFKITSLEAMMFHHLGQVSAAINLLEQLIPVIKQVYGKDYLQMRDYQISINNLANLYLEKNEFNKAKSYALEAYRLTSNTNNTLDKVNSLQNLGSIYRLAYMDDSASFFWHTALHLLASEHHQNTYIKTAIFNNLGEMYIYDEQYDSAIHYLTASLSIQESHESFNPPLHQTTLYNLAEAYHWSGDYPNADKVYQELIDDLLHEIKHNFSYLSDNEKMTFYKNQLDILESYVAFALEVSGMLPMQGTDDPFINPEIMGLLYDLQLTTKGIILNTSRRNKASILTSGDTTLVHIYTLWEQRKNQLAQLLLTGTTPAAEIQHLKTKIEENEKWLIANSTNFRSGFKMEQVSWKQIQKSLQPNEAAVEIIRLTGGLIYGALIITAQTTEQPKLSLIMSTRSKYLEKEAIAFYQNAILQQLNDPYSYGTFWKPIIDTVQFYMPSKQLPKRIYLSNDGIYNQINVNTLFDTLNKTYVIDQTEIIPVTNTKELLKDFQKSSHSKQAVLFGQPTFSSYKSSNETYEDLPGTGKEVQLINQLLVTKKWNTTVYQQKEATETNLKKISNATVLHLASHGFFQSKSETDEFSMAETMIQSGIVLAGVNDTSHTFEDGVLTAYEVTNLHLDATDLVVLSACETAKGVNNYGEGIYGLQHAFKAAGANHIIMSLWKVDDSATQKLMVEFYKNWMKSDNMRNAFIKAQKNLREAYTNPYYWGAFVLTGK